jgi:hypothetical protein
MMNEAVAHPVPAYLAANAAKGPRKHRQRLEFERAIRTDRNGDCAFHVRPERLKSVCSVVI